MKKIREIFRKIFLAELSCRRWCILVVSLSLGIVLGAALLAVVVDPHYRYHEPWFYDKVYYELYATAPNILQHENYDLLMLGTSMTRNFFLEDIAKSFHCKPLKLAASGGTPEDLRKFFEIARAARGRKLDRVILSLDIYSLNKTQPHWKEFEYLYRDDHLEDYRYLFSRQTFSSMIYLIKRKTSPKKQRPHQSDRNRMFATEYNGKPYGFAEVIADALANEELHHTQAPYDPEAHLKNLYGKLLPMFDDNPDITFTVYLPPYHIYTWCQSEFFHEAEGLLKQRVMVLNELIKRHNVTVYDFQSDRRYVSSFDHYADVQHFGNPAAKELLLDISGRKAPLKSSADITAADKALRELIRDTMPEFRRNMEQYRGK